MKIKKGDNVIVIAGADKGKRGKVLRALPSVARVVVEGVNMHKKHQRPKQSNQKGQVLEKPMSVHISNVAFADQASGKPSRVGRKLVGESFVRISKKSGATID